MGRKAGYKHTEEEKEKLKVARQKYLEKVGTVLGIREKDNKKEYMKAYQRRYRQLHPDYYRSRYKKKGDVIIKAEEMTKLKDAQDIWNEIVTSAIANEYNKFEKQTDIMPLVDKLHEVLIKYANEVKEEKKDEDKV